MRIVKYIYDKSNSLVRKDIDITGKNLEYVKQRIKATMRSACIKNKIAEFAAANPKIEVSTKTLPKVIADHPELLSLENWQVVAIDEYVEQLFV